MFRKNNKGRKVGRGERKDWKKSPCSVRQGVQKCDSGVVSSTCLLSNIQKFV